MNYSKLCTSAIVSVGLLASLALSAVATASPIIFDRGLPTANLNNVSGPLRSNVAWADIGSTTSIGDNFTLSYSSVIDTIRVWIVARNPVAPAASAYTLYLGNDLGTSTIVAPLAVGSSIATTTYSGGATYQATGGDMITIFQLDFAGLNLAVGPGTLAFSIGGPAASGLTTPFVHASNGPLSGSPQMGADGLIYGFDGAGLFDVSNGYPFNSCCGNGWDKSSDINVQVFGSVPEPSTFALIGMAMLSMFAFAMRRRSEA